MKKFAVIAVLLGVLVFVVKCTWSNSEIYYVVTATQPGSVIIEYTTPNGTVRNTYSLPYTSSKYVYPAGSFVSLTCSRYSGTGVVTLSIYREGTVWKTTSFEGTVSATVSGTL